MPALQLRASAHRDEGMIVIRCAAIGQVTWGTSLDDALSDFVRLLVEHFASVRQLGALDAETLRLGVDGPVGDSLTIECHVDLAEVLPFAQSSDVRLAVVAKAA